VRGQRRTAGATPRRARHIAPPARRRQRTLAQRTPRASIRKTQGWRRPPSAPALPLIGHIAAPGGRAQARTAPRARPAQEPPPPAAPRPAPLLLTLRPWTLLVVLFSQPTHEQCFKLRLEAHPRGLCKQVPVGAGYGVPAAGKQERRPVGGGGYLPRSVPCSARTPCERSGGPRRARPRRGVTGLGLARVPIRTDAGAWAPERASTVRACPNRS